MRDTNLQLGVSIQGIFEWSVWLVHRGTCVLRGHDLSFWFEPRRLSLRCTTCGYQTPGWIVDRPDTQPAITREADSEHRRGASPTPGTTDRLVLVKR
jgi:hypothetical protein